MKIFLTGATGYIGRRLLPVLLKNKIDAVCLIRDKRRFEEVTEESDKVTLIQGDLLKPETLTQLPVDIDAAYYFAHSMGTSSQNFYDLEARSAENFIAAVKKTNIKQIIYLSGIINDEDLSDHLRSRLNVENILKASGIPFTILRAPIIIGSGSASFEIIRDLVEKLPVMITPKWLNTKCQPIAVKNVIEYLTGVLLLPKVYNSTFDIGGPDILNYKEMLLDYAKVRNLKRLIITLPVLTPRLSSYWLYFVTSINFSLATSLVQSMKHDVTCRIKGIDKFVDVDLISYQDAIRRAFKKINSDQISSSWKDSAISGALSQNFIDNIKVPDYGCLIDLKRIQLKNNIEPVIKRVFSIGGDNGWYYMNWTWQLRGFVDKLVGGVGLRRGRRSPNELKPGDALDFWRVLFADKIEGKLILFAEMKLPGEAWLELNIRQIEGKNYFEQKATFRPNGLSGRIYWYSLLPIHKLIFSGMAKKISGT